MGVGRTLRTSAVSMKWVPSAPSTGSRGAGAVRGGWPSPPSGADRSRGAAQRPPRFDRPPRLVLFPGLVSVMASASQRLAGAGSGTSDSRKPAATTKQSRATTSESICCDGGSRGHLWCAAPGGGTKRMPSIAV